MVQTVSNTLLYIEVNRIAGRLFSFAAPPQKSSSSFQPHRAIFLPHHESISKELMIYRRVKSTRKLRAACQLQCKQSQCLFDSADIRATKRSPKVYLHAQTPYLAAQRLEKKKKIMKCVVSLEKKERWQKYVKGAVR